MADANLKTVAFVRHGETPLHVGANRFCGDLDPDLTLEGREQAAHARELLSHIMPEVDAAWTSPRLRARQTANLILPYAEWQVYDDLRELAFGEWEGLTKEEAGVKTPEAYRAWELDAYRNGPPGGESGLDAQPRVERIVDALSTSSAQNILVVSHITFLRLLIGLLIEIPLSEVRLRLDVQQGRVGLLEVSGRKAKLTALNR
ncbi:MAG: histidine phosphatase family protein [Acidobacteria bacterium]|nr:histidine phosphatase family protein [Acidobacteriota bacterium]